MSMYQGIDLSRFKKISSDGKSSTLRHSKGHEIKVAHNGLTPKMHDAIKNMPVHLAEGDEVRAMDPQSPAQTSDGSMPQQAAPAPVQAPQTPQQSIAQKAQEMTQHDLAFQQDLVQGKIKPKTYQDLYNNKDTLGKVSTLFGLLVSGAGSGLAGQPNAVMEMMNKEIQNDLEGQKQSNENAQNWYRLNQQHELQKYQQQEIGARTLTEQAHGVGVAAEADLAREKLKQLPGADLTLSNKAANLMMLAYTQKQQDDINRMPPGPMRDQYQQALDNTVRPGVLQKVTQNNIQSAGHQELKNAVTKSVAQEYPAVNNKKLNAILQNSGVQDNLGMTPDIPSGDRSKIQEEAGALNSDYQTMKRYDHAFKALWNAKDKGSLNKSLYNAETAILGPETARSTAGGYNEKESHRQGSGMFPSWEDFVSGAAPEKYNNSMNAFKDRSAKYTTLKRYGEKYPGLVNPPPTFESPFEKKKEEASAKSSGPQEGATGTFKGKPVIFRDGKWTAK